MRVWKSSTNPALNQNKESLVKLLFLASVLRYATCIASQTVEDSIYCIALFFQLQLGAKPPRHRNQCSWDSFCIVKYMGMGFQVSFCERKTAAGSSSAVFYNENEAGE